MAVFDVTMDSDHDKVQFGALAVAPDTSEDVLAR